MSQGKDRQAEASPSSSSLLFYSHLQWVGEVHLHWGEPSVSLSLLLKCTSRPEIPSQMHPKYHLTTYLGTLRPRQVDTEMHHKPLFEDSEEFHFNPINFLKELLRWSSQFTHL